MNANASSTVALWPGQVASISGYFGAHLAQKANPEHVRAIIIVIGFTPTVYFFAKPYQH